MKKVGTIYFTHPQHPIPICLHWKFLHISAKKWLSALSLLLFILSTLNAFFFLTFNNFFVDQKPKALAQDMFAEQNLKLASPPPSQPPPVLPEASVDPILHPTPTPMPQIQFPLASYKKLTTQFSSYHPGIDLSAKSGTPVYAIEEGTVSEAGWSNLGFGKNIVINSNNADSYQRYGHLSSIFVSKGQFVSTGTQIGSVGCTGNCTGPHLHLEIYQQGRLINPLTLF